MTERFRLDCRVQFKEQDRETKKKNNEEQEQGESDSTHRAKSREILHWAKRCQTTENEQFLSYLLIYCEWDGNWQAVF
jgi:hypothetical protein